MQKNDTTQGPGNVEMCCFSDGENDVEQLVIFELVVPKAAKVPAPRQHVRVARLVVQHSTVPGHVLTQLRANNTALGAAWCITATLAAQPSAVF